MIVGLEMLASGEDVSVEVDELRLRHGLYLVNLGRVHNVATHLNAIGSRHNLVDLVKA